VVVTAGLGVLVMAVLCGVGFVASTARADAALTGEPTTAGLDGPRRWWLLAAVLLAVGSVLMLAAGVFA
jgi:hypothetical protein